jgi:hypothetical protein
MGHYVGVHALGEMEPNGTAAWIGVWIVVRDRWHGRRIRKTHRGWSRWPVQMRSSTDLRRFRRRRERALQQDAFGMSWSKAWMYPEDLVEFF